MFDPVHTQQLGVLITFAQNLFFSSIIFFCFIASYFCLALINVRRETETLNEDGGVPMAGRKTAVSFKDILGKLPLDFAGVDRIRISSGRMLKSPNHRFEGGFLELKTTIGIFPIDVNPSETARAITALKFDKGIEPTIEGLFPFFFELLSFSFFLASLINY